MRLIDADAVFEELDDMPWTEYKKYKVLRVINTAPTIDAIPREWHDKCMQIEIDKRMDMCEACERVEVVRCKDCDSYVEVAYWFDDKDKRHECNICTAHIIEVNTDDYCSFGERREP